jgi:hypothetical protein
MDLGIEFAALLHYQDFYGAGSIDELIFELQRIPNRVINYKL